MEKQKNNQDLQQRIENAVHKVDTGSKVPPRRNKMVSKGIQVSLIEGKKIGMWPRSSWRINQLFVYNF